jgi:RNA polymerase sigma factor (sigma-70 family)
MTLLGHFRLVLTAEFPHNLHAVGFPRVTTHKLYSEHADTIESVLAYTRRAHRLSADDGEEFSSWARLRLLEDDCAVLAKFQGLSSFKTFIVVVLNRLFLDWRINEWGKWRPTPRARRLGRLAVELERLVLRDGLEYGQAAQTLISKGLAVTEVECDGVWEQLRRRGGRRRVDLDDVPELPTPAHDPVERDERQLRARRAIDAMNVSIAGLPADDQMIFRLRYLDGVSVARIAKLIGADQKPLYRRFEQIQKQLRQGILDTGLSEEDVRDLFGGFDVDDDDADPGTGNGGNRPSIALNAGGPRV